MNFSNLSFKKKIFCLLLLPMLGFVGLSVNAIFNNLKVKNEMSTIAPIVELSVVYSELVHELQKERGLTAGFLGSKGTKFGNKLLNQRHNTDQKRTKKTQFWNANDISHNSIVQSNNNISQALNKITLIRQQVDDQSIPLGKALAFYTQLNKELIEVALTPSKISNDATLVKESIAYYNFLQGKERAGVERAVLSNTFAKTYFDTGMYKKFVTLVSEQITYFNSFNHYSNIENRQYFEQKLDNNFVKEVKRIREIAFNQQNNFAIKAEYWFEQSTGRIGQLKQVENYLDEKILTLITTKEKSAFNVVLFNSIICVVFSLLTIIVSLYIINELSNRVSNLKELLHKVRNDNNLSVRSPVEDKSELGQISQSINNMLESFSNVIKDISSSSMTLASAAEETAQTCDYNSQLLFQQQDGIGLIATATEELSSTVKEVAESTQNTASSAKKADEQAQNGLITVQTSYKSIETLANEIDSLAKKINSLHSSSTNSSFGIQI